MQSIAYVHPSMYSAQCSLLNGITKNTLRSLGFRGVDRGLFGVVCYPRCCLAGCSRNWHPVIGWFFEDGWAHGKEFWWCYCNSTFVPQQREPGQNAFTERSSGVQWKTERCCPAYCRNVEPCLWLRSGGAFINLINSLSCMQLSQAWNFDRNPENKYKGKIFVMKMSTSGEQLSCVIVFHRLIGLSRWLLRSTHVLANESESSYSQNF